jgi:transcriptional regulator with XRE-family HTH domain
MRNTEITIRIGTRIRALRTLAGMTQGQLAEAAGVSRSYVPRIEAGSVEATVTTLSQLAEALGVDMAQVLGETPVRQRPEEAAVRLLEYAVTQSRGVPIRLRGWVSVSGFGEVGQGEDATVVNVPLDWVDGRDLDTLFVLEVLDDILTVDGIPAGSQVLMRTPDPAAFVVGDRLLVRDAGSIRLETWPFLLSDDQIESVATATDMLTGWLIIGVLLVSWRKHS